MFSFIKKYTETMHDQTFYPIFSLVIFVAFFVGVIWYVRSMDKNETSQMKNLPLEQ